MRDYIVKNAPTEGNSVRINCPSCGKKTFTISKIHGKLLWNCYVASCKISGAMKTERSKTEIASQIAATITHYHTHGNFSVPAQFTPFSENERALRYLEKNNCIDAYKNQRARILYDPKQDRVVFLVQKNGITYDAIGRALQRGVVPKWYRYGKSQKLFTAGNHSQAVLVEDAASACAISPVATGVALLGTNMKDADLTQLREFNKVFVCLDPDATRKALDIQKYLSYFVSSIIIRINDDLKYYEPQEIRQLLQNSS
jgi:ribosomal protein L37AE/L43A